jgi:multidrug efflux pump subunit AcrA (membrane-fusion protein)
MKSRAPLCILPIVLALGGCGRKSSAAGVEASSAAPPIQVKLAQAQAREVERSIAVTGSLAPDESVNLSFEVAGTLARVNVDFGQTARRGQVLAELDQREAMLQLERIRAALAQAIARAGLKAGDEGSSPESSPAVRQSLAQSKTPLEIWSARKLVASGDISRERYRSWKNPCTRGKRRIKRRGMNCACNLLPQRPACRVKLAEKKLGDTVMRAPFDGAVTAKLISPGQFVKRMSPSSRSSSRAHYACGRSCRSRR